MLLIGDSSSLLSSICKKDSNFYWFDVLTVLPVRIVKPNLGGP
jgi:hypothetical protein